MRPRMLIGAGCVALLLAPALARSQSPSVTAVDAPSAWRVSPGGGTTLTVPVGTTVALSYAGNGQHYVQFTSGPTPECTGGVPMQFTVGPWSGECTFRTAGEYEFICPVHHAPPVSTMRATVVAVPPSSTPGPTATPTPTGTPGPSGTPQPGATPPPSSSDMGPTSEPQAPAQLKLRLRSGQRGSRVRGHVEVPQARSRLVVTLRARLSRARVTVGRLVRTRTRAGRLRFSVPLNARAKRVLRARKRLALTVTVALTPPGERTITHRRTVRLRR